VSAGSDCEHGLPGSRAVDWANVGREVKVGASLVLRNTFTYDGTTAPFDMTVNIIERALESSSQVLGTQVL